MASNLTASPLPQTPPPSDDGTAYSSTVSLFLNALPGWAKLAGATAASSQDSSLYTTTNTLILLVLLLLFPFLVVTVRYSDRSASNSVSNTHLPIINPSFSSHWLFLDIAKLFTIKDFMQHGVDYLYQARDRFCTTAGDQKNDNKKMEERPYRMETDTGEVTVLPAQKYANEVKSDPRMGFLEPLKKSLHGHMRGFDIFTKGGMENLLVVEVVRQDLTRELGKLTGALTEETAFALGVLLGEDQEYHEVHVNSFVQELVARLSSRVFLGEELCRNRQWLDININSTITHMTAAVILRLFPWFLRPILNEVLPICRKIRAEQSKARALILPIVAQRKALRAQLVAAGASPAEIQAAVKNDGLEWFERMASRSGRVYEPELSQLSLSMAAIHTTSDLLTQAILDLAEHPEIIPDLRAEIIAVLGTQGWRKTSLYGLKLLDSCIRETQRLKPIAAASMSRELLEDMTLSDGTLLRKGSQILVSSLPHWDPTLYTDPNTWDGYRFYRPAQSQRSATHTNDANGNASHPVGEGAQIAAATTSAEHIAFGHGAHACPGRFFAINEAKVALAHLLIKYDWELVDGKKPQTMTMGFALLADQKARIRVRRRAAEMDLDALEVV